MKTNETFGEPGSVAVFFFHGVPARLAETVEDGVVTGDFESRLLFGYMGSHQGDRNIDIVNEAATLTMNVVVAVGTLVEAAGLIGEREFLDQVMLRQEVKRAVNGAIRDGRVPAPDTLEDLTGGKMPLRVLDLGQDDRSLRGIAIRATR
jgi:hypothetical protein